MVGLVEPFAELARQHGQLGGDRCGFGGGGIQGGAHHRQRSAQLVRGAGGEPALGGEGGFQPVQQVVDGVAEVFELIIGAGHGQPLTQVLGRDRPGGSGDLPQRAQRPPGHQPAQHSRDHGHHTQRDGRLSQQLVQRGRMLGCGLDAYLGRDRGGRGLDASRRRGYQDSRRARARAGCRARMLVIVSSPAPKAGEHAVQGGQPQPYSSARQGGRPGHPAEVSDTVRADRYSRGCVFRAGA